MSQQTMTCKYTPKTTKQKHKQTGRLLTFNNDLRHDKKGK